MHFIYNTALRRSQAAKLSRNVIIKATDFAISTNVVLPSKMHMHMMQLLDRPYPDH